MQTIMERTIDNAVRGTKPATAARMRALATVRWVLITEDGRFVTVNDRAQALLTHDAADATIYDARDNEVLKHRFMETLLGVQLTVVLLDE